MIQAVIFDLDGVLVDTARYHFMAWQRLAHELGIEFTEKENEQLKGVSRMRSLEIILEMGNLQLSFDEMNKLADKKNKWFVQYISRIQATEIFPGIKELMGAIRQSGLKIALASSSKNADTVITLLGIKDFFDVMIDGTMITHTKPDPEIFLLAAQKLGVHPSHCLVYEDAEAGVEAAHAAGMKCVGIGLPEQLRTADYRVTQAPEFSIEKIKSVL
ncbi:MAG: beta-phosphoglucomutase [Bacteroidetes bacterium]|nr:beta-phosphoglucomutase [Bacteroidota bacterium]